MRYYRLFITYQSGSKHLACLKLRVRGERERERKESLFDIDHDIHILRRTMKVHICAVRYYFIDKDLL